MNKEEILEMARKEKDDELITHVNNRALLLIVILTVFMAAISAVGSAIDGKPASQYFVIANAPLAAGFLYRFIKTKKRFDLVMFFVTLAQVFAGLAGMAMGY